MNSISNYEEISFVPITWKKWHALLRGVLEEWITPTDDNGEALLDIIANIEAEAGQSIKGFPPEVLEAKDPDTVTGVLKEAAERVYDEYTRAGEKLASFPKKVSLEFDSMIEDCGRVLRLAALARSTPDRFNSNDIATLHELTSGHSFKALPIDVFKDLIKINSSVVSAGQKMIPVPGGEMSFYTLMVVLFQKSRLISGITGVIDPATWSKLYSGKIGWSESAEPDSWINHYIYNEPFDPEYDSQTGDDEMIFLPSDSDRMTLETFLGRRSFNRLCDKEELISHGFSNYETDRINVLAKIAAFKENRQNTLRKLHRLVYEETLYPLRTRERNSGRFLSQEDAYHVRMDDQFFQGEIKKMEELLDKIFLGEETDGKDILFFLDQLDDFRFYVPLSDKPLVSSTMIKGIIDSCVIANEEIKSILREAILEEKFIDETDSILSSRTSQTQDKTPDQNGIQAILAELRSGGYIDNEGTINLSGAKFARHMVKSGYVKPGKSWKPWFRNPEWIRFSDEGFISNNEIQELTKELNWKPFDGIFKDKDGKRLSSSNLSKFFSDGDSSYSKRNALFLQIYHRLNQKTAI